MAFIFSGDEHYREFTREDAYRTYLITRDASVADVPPGVPRFKRLAVHARHAVNRIDGFIARSIEALAEAKLRRLHRELALNGVQQGDVPDESRRLRVVK